MFFRALDTTSTPGQLVFRSDEADDLILELPDHIDDIEDALPLVEELFASAGYHPIDGVSVFEGDIIEVIPLD